MNQSAFIAGALLAGFVLFLAANNRLGVYASILWGSRIAPGGSSTGTKSATVSVGSATGSATAPIQ